MNDELIFKITLDNYADVYGKNNKILVVKIINQKITSISKSSGIMDFLNQYKLIPKIIVVAGVSQKTRYILQNIR